MEKRADQLTEEQVAGKHMLLGLAAAFVTLIFGKFSDMYGRRIMLLVSLPSQG